MPAAGPGAVGELIDTESALDDFVAELRDESIYAIDTEFHRERTYYPAVGLIQLATPSRIALLDPLAIDVRPLGPVLEGPGLVVMHAASQDLEALERVCEATPSRLFDTQLAAGFLGYGSPSLASLVARFLDIDLPKGDRLADWLRRPLPPKQLSYAAADVAHLIELYTYISTRLEELGRLEWAADECEALRLRGGGRRDPDEAWWRIKEARQLRGRAAGVAQVLAAWRDRRAATLDQPIRRVLSDLALVGIAQRSPTSADDLAQVRGVDGRQLRGGLPDEILAAVKQGEALSPRELRLPDASGVDRELRPAVTLTSAWVSQLARDLAIDASLLATRNDIEAFLRGEPDARLAQGWRASVAGEPIRRLVDGTAALAFDGQGGLVLEARSGAPFVG